MTMAVVAKAGPNGLQYLADHLDPLVGWTAAERQARRFVDLHEATRAALTLSARHRAFALPEAGAGRAEAA